MRARTALAAFAAIMLLAAALTAALASRGGADTSATVYSCLSNGQLNRVSLDTPRPCSSSATPIAWAGQRVAPSPSPTSPSPTGTSPSPSPTTTSASPSPTGTATGFSCVTSSPSGVCGAYDYPGITNSNGYNTYVANNCWADPSCAQTLSANSPGDWQVASNEPAGNTSVRTYPDVQQLFSDWTGGGWNSGPNVTDTPVSGLAGLSSDYAETTPYGGGTDAQFAWDIWMSSDSGYPGEVMVWVDNSGRGDGGATQVGTATIGGQDWTAYEYGSGEFIWSLGAPGTFARQGAGTVDLLALMRWMQANGFMAPGAAIGQIDAGWEICSTGGTPETFAVSKYTLTAAAA